MAFTASDIIKIIVAIVLPPLGVFFERGCGADLLINILLTVLGYIPGIIHAVLLAKHIANLPEDKRPTLIFSSPYYRCLQTTQPTAEILSLPIHVEHGLSEWYSQVEPGTGLHPRPYTAQALQQYFPSIDTSWESICLPDRRGETIEGVHARCDEFLRALVSRIEQHPTLKVHENILLVSHAATAIALVRSLVGDKQLPLRVGTCTLSTLNRVGKDGFYWEGEGVLAGADFLPNGVERDWGFEDVRLDETGTVVNDGGIPGTENEDPGFSGIVPEKSILEPTSASRTLENQACVMPPAKSAPKKGLVVAKKGTKKALKPAKRKKDNTEYDGSDVSENEDLQNPASNDSNDMDMDLIRAAFASAKSKNAKKNNTEFLKQQKALIDTAREQAEMIQVAGNAHLEKLVEQFETLCQAPDKNDIAAVAASVGQRSEAANALVRSLTLSLEQVAADYEEAIQAAGEEFQNRVACREKIRRSTVRHARQILTRGMEEQKLITDATDMIKHFQRLMKM
ncbi:hypothetical protein FRC07_003173 [Ceratobasidium sp. 392]|nr:hypothetical protein FRC07_003173 [Ceratobasidium sp. 392]